MTNINISQTKTKAIAENSELKELILVKYHESNQ
jgi:hypothetical protein